MKTPGLPPFPLSLRAPLRDMRRAVSGLAELTEDALNPMAEILPEPLRKAVHHAMHAVKDVTRRSYQDRLDRKKLIAASAYLNGRGSGVEDVAALAKLVGFGWDYLSEHTVQSPCWMYSEAMAAAALARTGQDGQGLPGSVYQTLMTSAAIGLLPGAQILAPQETEGQPALLVASSLLWLMTARGATAEEELRLLDMAYALGRASQLDKLHIQGTDEISERLTLLARHL